MHDVGGGARRGVGVGWVLRCVLFGLLGELGGVLNCVYYVGILPTRFDTPMFWSAEDLAELQGTAVVGACARSSFALASSHTRCRQARPRAGGEGLCRKSAACDRGARPFLFLFVGKCRLTGAEPSGLVRPGGSGGKVFACDVSFAGEPDFVEELYVGEGCGR